MKRWGLLTVVCYLVLMAALLWPLAGAWLPEGDAKDFRYYWFAPILAALCICQILLPAVPIRICQQRKVPRRKLPTSIVTFAFLLAALVATGYGSIIADAKSDYEMLFGDQVKKVLATKSTADDAVFAKKLLDAAKAMTDAPKTQLFLYEKVVEFGSKDTAGSPHALEAIDILSKAQPAQKAKWQEAKLNVTEKQYQASRGADRKEAAKAYLDLLIETAEAKDAAGKAKEAYQLYRKAHGVARYLRSPRVPEIAARIKQINLRAIAAAKRESRFKKLTATLAANPNNLEVRTELILVCVVELDNPAKAGSLLASGVDQKLRECVPLAAKKPADLTEITCLKLGQWYHKTLLGKTSVVGKAVVLARARMYYEHYLGLHAKRDAGQYKASTALAEVNKELAKLRRAAPSPKLPRGKFLTLDLGKGVMMKLIRIPAGSFMMGSPESEEGRGGDEGPQHKVTISKPFHMGVTEVTVGQFAAFVAATGYKTQAEKEGWARVLEGQWKNGPGAFWRKCGFDQTAQHPVTCISLNDAVAFCKWLGKKTRRSVRLPTEAKWEYACRAGTKTRFCFGDDDKHLGDYAWYLRSSGGKTHPVGQKKPNAWGLYDIPGNVWEWCADRSAHSYANAKAVDPQGAASGSNRVLRGGSWSNWPGDCRSANRLRMGPDLRSQDIGFRVVVATRAGGR